MTGHIASMTKPNFRDQILTAGLEALHSRGFNATSVQDITEAAGVPKGSFYNHFASKEDLGAAVVEQYTLRTAKRRAILADVRLAPMARIRSYFEAMVALPKYPGAPGCLLGNFGAELSNQSPAIRERVSAAFEDWSLTLARVIEEAQSAGDLKTDIPAKATAAFLIDAWEGAVLRAKVEQSRAPLEAFLEMTFARILV
jgi:TetR/AcrR family transcriptional repressor of nem operon